LYLNRTVLVAACCTAGFLTERLSAGSNDPTLTVSPSSRTVHALASFQLTVTTANIDSPTIVWSANGVAGGDDVNGTISSTGLYTAPATIPAVNPVVVQAVLMVSTDPASTTNPTQTVNFTITNPVPVISSIAPARIATGPFALTVTGAGFLSGTTAASNGNVLQVASVTPQSITLTGTAISSDIGTQLLTLTNPDPGHSTSLPVEFVVSNTLAPLLSTTEASRFLNYATFGPTRASLDELQSLGYKEWLKQQFVEAPSEFPAILDNLDLDWTQAQFFVNAMTGTDQLRQRMAFALHQIFVVSGVKVNYSPSYVPYLRTLQADAFVNFRQVMEDIALNPSMGEFLDMVNNDRIDPSSGASPNENFARELMQLFTLGLTQLNPDGTPIKDQSGIPLSTYSESDIGEYARVYTGWTYPPVLGATTNGHNQPNYTGQMVAYEPNHDEGSKNLLNGVVLPAGNTAQQDLEAALDNIFNHPNVGPFIASNLIQHFVTSNPSPAYVGRVAAAFNDTNGVRGDLAAVLTAILTDPEALSPPADTGGHLREPVLFVASVMRAVGGIIADHPFLSDSSQAMGQQLLFAPSVFNYFSPAYRILSGAMLAPEFQILTAQTVIERVNYVGNLLYGNFGGDVQVDLARFETAAADPNVLLDMVNTEVMGGLMSPDVQQAILTAVQAQRGSQNKALTALYLAFSSSQYQVIH
jgi:uncharacterized protein (DUF1800 family)